MVARLVRASKQTRLENKMAAGPVAGGAGSAFYVETADRRTPRPDDRLLD
jgi:hypothetical protein